ncbi:MAG: TonB-dependent receptor [Leptothrix sp. (in: b-proteobacteria)]
MTQVRPPHSAIALAVLGALFGLGSVHAQTPQAEPAPAVEPATVPAEVPVNVPVNLPVTAPAATPIEAPAEVSPAAEVPAVPTAPALERVEITGGSSDARSRLQSTAAKTVIGREELDRMGDSSVTEVLKRLPGVTLGGRPGRGGAVRMRGMGNGYTQILVNGERQSAGLSLDDLSPDQVERIEVLRAPTAETGAQAIAGTINIVLREDVRKRLNNVQLTAAHDEGRWQPTAAWTRSDQLGDFSYNLNGHLSHSDRLDTSLLRTTETTTDDASGASATTLDQTDTSRTRDQRDSIHLGGRLQWKLGERDTLALQPFMILSRSSGTASGTRTQAVASTAPDYDRYQSRSSGDFQLGKMSGTWSRRFDDGARLEARGSVSLSAYNNDSTRDESLLGVANRSQLDHSQTTERWWSQGGKYTQNLVTGSHQLATGWELEGGQREDGRASTQTLPGGAPTSLLANFGDNLQARTLRTSLWAQDEWNVNPQWALQGGLRWEAIHTRSDTPTAPVDNTSSVVSPLLHALYRLEEGGNDQVRASLTRSYRAPTLQNLAARPAIDSRFPVTAINPSTSPDRAGNPELKPELATGLDLAYERHGPNSSVMSVGVFHRRIHDLIRNQTALESVSWSASPRFVSRPQNIGAARTSGVELEAKFRLSDVQPEALPVDIRSNLALFKSAVDGISGPNNRIDQQPGWTANLGADYRLRGWPLTVGGNLALTPSYLVQQSPTQAYEQDAKRVLDAYAAWTFSPALLLRVSASNLMARDFNSANSTVADNGISTVRQTALNTDHSLTVWSLRLEMKL